MAAAFILIELGEVVRRVAYVGGAVASFAAMGLYNRDGYMSEQARKATTAAFILYAVAAATAAVMAVLYTVLLVGDPYAPDLGSKEGLKIIMESFGPVADALVQTAAAGAALFSPRYTYALLIALTVLSAGGVAMMLKPVFLFAESLAKFLLTGHTGH